MKRFLFFLFIAFIVGLLIGPGAFLITLGIWLITIFRENEANGKDFQLPPQL